MAAGGFKTFIAGEVLDEDDINDYLMQGVLVFSGTAARGSAIGLPVEGQFAFLTDSDTLTYFDGSQWVTYESGIQYAPVSSTSGSPGTGTFVDGSETYEYYRWTSNGSVVFSDEGIVDVLVVGGGGGGRKSGAVTAGGGAGAVRWGTFQVSAGTVAVIVGNGGGGGTGDGASTDGAVSSFGDVLKAGGGSAGLATDSAFGIKKDAIGGGGAPGTFNINQDGNFVGGGAGGLVYGSAASDGISLNFTGSAVSYGPGGVAGDPAANSGGGGSYNGGAGAAGVVILKVRQ
jgi:hypothetical protein